MSERWADEFAARARAVWTAAETQRVTQGKDLPILPAQAPVLLRALGLLHRDASMPPPQVRKFLQLNHMLRLLGPPLRELMERFESPHIVDAGCGLSYLTLSLAWCFEHVFTRRATLLGVDRDPARIAACQAATEQVGLGDVLRFEATAIESFRSAQKVHAVLSLHACDTATDDAIALGLEHGAELIAVAPCCQAELARSWAARAAAHPGQVEPGCAPDDEVTDALRPLWATPHLRREAAATITDALRMLLLRAAGYEVRVVEFVPSQHTPKNTLIRAMWRGAVDPTAWQEFVALRDAMGGADLKLERSLPSVLARQLGGHRAPQR